MGEIKQIIVRPVVRTKFSGVSSYARTQTIIQGAQLDKTGLYKTGLTSEEQEHFEVELGLRKGELNKRSPFWGDLEIRLNNDKITIFTIVSPLDELKYKVMLAHSKIANSEVEVGKSADCQFFIYDPEAAAQIESAKIDYELEAIEAFSSMSLEQRKNLLRVYGKRGVEDMSETMVRAELYKKMKENAKEFIEYSSKKETQVKGMIEALIEKGVIKKKGTYFYNGEDLLGSSTDEVVGYLSDIKNQAVKLALESKLKKKKEAKV